MFNNGFIKREIRKKIEEGNKKFAIYPFGENGLRVKTILYEYFGILPVFIVDNMYAGINANIINIYQMKDKYDDSVCVILTIENSKKNMKMQSELLDFVNIDNILNLQSKLQNEELEKKYTLLEYIADKSEKYRKNASKLLLNKYANQNIVKIYSYDEIGIIGKLCYDFVKEQMEKEVKTIYDIKNKGEKILFFAPLFESYWSNILPLMKEFIKREHKCVVMFCSIEDFWWTKENIQRVLYIIKEIKEEGGECLLYDELLIPEIKFSKCFFCSEYSTTQPEILRQYAKQLISVQTTGIYKHIYKSQIGIGQLYRELESVDYYIGSDYICEWINRQNDIFEAKMLKLGYPKMDTLYKGLSREMSIPKEWEKEMKGRKVILLTIENPEIYVDIFQKFPQFCFIWRPDPEFLGTKSCNSKISKLRDGIKHLVIDENRTYVNSFKASTAMIGMAIFCVPVNYIFTGKPFLLLDAKLNMYFDGIAMEYEDEAWYKAGYIADNLGKIDEFLNMVMLGEHYLAKQQKQYLDEMNKNYDGKVCSRICDFFETTDID